MIYSALKNYKNVVKCMSIKYKFITLKEFLSAAWNRVWNGYDYSDIWNMNENFNEKMISTLTEFRVHHMNASNIAIEETDDFDKANEQFDRDIDEMIQCFKNCNEYVANKIVLGKDYDYENDPNFCDNAIKVNEFMKKNQKRALELFVKYFDDLDY